jgi:hypothetical protein
MSNKQSTTITNVTPENLDEIYNNKTINGCIILYHWNNCGHCNRFKPTWDALKDIYGNTKQFYDIELTALREAEQYERFPTISSFPTIHVFPKNSEEYIEYSGTRDIDHLSNFIETTVPNKSTSTSKSNSKSNKPTSKSTSKSTSKPTSNSKSKSNK